MAPLALRVLSCSGVDRQSLCCRQAGRGHCGRGLGLSDSWGRALGSPQLSLGPEGLDSHPTVSLPGLSSEPPLPTVATHT